MYVLNKAAISRTLSNRLKRKNEILDQSTARPALIENTEYLECRACGQKLEEGDLVVSRVSGTYAYVKRVFYHIECARQKNII